MSVLPMKRVTICALKKNRKEILELLQRRGVIEISSAVQEDSVFKKSDISSSKAVFQKNAAIAAQALSVLDNYAPEEKSMLSMLEGRKELSVQDYEAYVGSREDMLKTANHLLALNKQAAENSASIPKLEAQMEALKPWLGFELPLDFKGTEKTAAFVGALPNSVSLQEIHEAFTEYAPHVDFSVDVVSTSDEQTCILVVCLRKHAGKVEEALAKMGFARPPMSSVIPEESRITLERELSELNSSLEALRGEIVACADKRDSLRFMEDYYSMRAEKYDVLGGLAQSSRVFLLTGYIPEREASGLEAELNASFDVAFDLEDPGEDEDVPILLHNNGFAAPLEGVIESYSLPGRGEIDPCTIVACFYYIFFGMMLSDAAYGLIMVIGCAFALSRYKTMESGLKKTLKMFLYCGISTTFWGFMFGGFFGDAVNIVADVFFHRPDVKLAPLWFEPVKEPMKLLIFAFAIGILHLFVGLGAKLYICVKNRQYKEALYDVIFWYMLVGGGIAYLLTMPMFVEMLGIPFILPSVVASAATVSAAVSAAGIILTSGRESRNWGKRILKGLYGLYNVSGYLSDILSYSRLLALGLATGVIATVFNKMGSMAGDGIVGIIVFILVFIVGHVMNIGVNLLGAYVHTNRLQYVEFFGKFYEGGGRKFTPFTTNTKYYKIKEDI